MSEVPHLVTLRGQTGHVYMPIFFLKKKKILEFSETTRAALQSWIYQITFSNPETPSVLCDVLYAQNVEFDAILLDIRASSGACECCFAPTV